MIDSLAYGKLAVVPWNIVQYNLFGGEGRGPDLYGTEPWYFYIQNLLLNFNILLPLALLSLPALGITHTLDYRRLGLIRHQLDETSPYILVTLRLAPFYIWTAVLTLQPHKEERFMYPAYPLLCFNAATTLYLVRGWLEVMYTKAVSVYAVRQILSQLLGTLLSGLFVGLPDKDLQSVHFVGDHCFDYSLRGAYPGPFPLLPRAFRRCVLFRTI